MLFDLRYCRCFGVLDSGYDSLSESESEGDNFVDDEGYLGDDEDSSDDEANRDVCFRHPENWRGQFWEFNKNLSCV